MQFIRLRYVSEMLGVSRTTLWRMVRAGTFPPPLCITQHTRGYLCETVENWMTARAESTAVEPPLGSAPPPPRRRPPAVGWTSARRNRTAVSDISNRSGCDVFS